MELFYAVIFGVMAFVAASLEFFKPSESQAVNARKDFVAFRLNYVIVYSLMMGAGWLWLKNSVGSAHVKLFKACVAVQLVTGFKGPMCMLCTNTTALTAQQSDSCSLLDLAHHCFSAHWLDHWQMSGAPRVLSCRQHTVTNAHEYS